MRYIVFLSVLCICSCAVGQPATPTDPSWRQGYVSGYTDARAGVPPQVLTTRPATEPVTRPATQPATRPATRPTTRPAYPIPLLPVFPPVPPPPVPPVTVHAPSGTDLAIVIDQLSTSPKPYTVVCDAGGKYKFGHTIDVKPAMAWLTVDGRGASVSLFSTPGNSTNIRVYADQVTIKNFVILQSDYMVRPCAKNFHMIACVGNNMWSVVTEDQPQRASGTLVQDCTFGPHVGKVALYFTGDYTRAIHDFFAGDVREYEIRIEVNHGFKANVNLVQNCRFIMTNNKTQGIRMGDNTYWIDNVFVGGGIRYGQQPPANYPPITNPKACAAGAVFVHNSFYDIIPSSGNPLTIKQGVEIIAVGNRFYSKPSNVLFPTALSAESTAVFADNVLVHPASLHVPPLVSGSVTTPYVEVGTVEDTDDAHQTPPDMTPPAHWPATIHMPWD